jgi:uncharacterized protein YndB with AHSA1/START domain
MATIATKPSLTIKRRFKAAPAAVYNAWTEPAKIAQWFGPPGTKVIEAEFETRTGGRFMILAKGESGDEFHVSGVVREAVANARLVYSWAWRSTPERESLVTVEFKPDGDGTLLLLTHEQFFDDEARDRHQQGWNGALTKLDAYLA